MKKVLIGLIAFFSVFSVVLVKDVSAKKTTKKETIESPTNETTDSKKDIEFAADPKRIKVYLFEAGGCPYCELEQEYLEGLPSYGVKFEIVKKQLYIDHVKWEPGEDYELGKKVAEEFINNGFTKASYKSTPFVVISDIYATAGYNKELESIIDKAYEEGDKDAVSCIANNNKNCIKNDKKIGDTVIVVTVLVILVAGLTGLVIYSRKQ